MSESYNSSIKRNREIISCIIDAIVLRGEQNLALRGHEEKDSNLIAILYIRAKGNNELADHLAFADPNKKYTSPNIQNELIDLCADKIINSLEADCNATWFFTISRTNQPTVLQKNKHPYVYAFMTKMQKLFERNYCVLPRL